MSESLTVDQRVAKIERGLRLRDALIVALGGAVLLLTFQRHEPPVSPPPAAPAPALNTAPLSVVDGEGRPRATLGISPEGAAYLELLAPSGKGRVRIEAGDQAGELLLTDGGGARRVRLGWAEEAQGADSASLTLLDRAGQPRATLSAGEAVPTLNLYNEQGVTVAGLP